MRPDIAFNAQLRALEAELLRAQLFMTGLAILFIAVVLVLCYFVIRYAIRDGIRDSGLLEARARQSAAVATSRVTDLPDMRAD